MTAKQRLVMFMQVLTVAVLSLTLMGVFDLAHTWGRNKWWCEREGVRVRGFYRSGALAGIEAEVDGVRYRRLDGQTLFRTERGHVLSEKDGQRVSDAIICRKVVNESENPWK